MLDTVKLRSPAISESAARAIEGSSFSRRGVNLVTGEIVYEITSGELAGSYDHRVRVRVRRDRPVQRASSPGARPTTVYLPCSPYLEVEGSIHKFIAGHNVYGGPVDIRAATRAFLFALALSYDVVLPPADEWVYRRVDWAEAFDVGPLAALEYVRAMARARYPKRKPLIYKDEAVMFVGAPTWKIYRKGEEFRKHDRKRLLMVADERLTEAEIFALGDYADGILRVEVGIKAQTLDRAWASPTVGMVDSAWVLDEWERATMSVIREVASPVAVVRSADAVRSRLRSLYGTRLSGSLYGFWCDMSTRGEAAAKASESERSFYRKRGQLVAAGVSWLGTDVQLLVNGSELPEGFAPTRFDSRRLTAVSDRVAEFCKYFAA